MRLFQKIRGSFPDKLRFFSLLWDILKGFEAFVGKCEAFVKITRLLKDIFREVEAFLN
jgi:hypothetical protein